MTAVLASLDPCRLVDRLSRRGERPTTPGGVAALINDTPTPLLLLGLRASVADDSHTEALADWLWNASADVLHRLQDRAALATVPSAPPAMDPTPGELVCEPPELADRLPLPQLWRDIAERHPLGLRVIERPLGDSIAGRCFPSDRLIELDPDDPRRDWVPLHELAHLFGGDLGGPDVEAWCDQTADLLLAADANCWAAAEPILTRPRPRAAWRDGFPDDTVNAFLVIFHAVVHPSGAVV